MPNPAPVNLPVDWSPSSWRQHPALQMPTYPDQAALDATLGELHALPPLVTSWEILALKKQIANFKVPKHIFVVPDLPRNAMGKVQKNLLREQHRGLFAG